ncbi:SET domain-containing protein [Fusarium mexicanum]|uniref:SET domain-containing protein n=1 Tax=Fusarium mexicanum TaxID=751941 RepID=A0A8H5MX46_9HYPO|nr:SET domain-containing protein [Fusarium mexicanum]
MGIEIGFDMVPRLSSGAGDQQAWKEFIDHVRAVHHDDSKVKVRANYIEFEVGEYPRLPFESYRFLRFSSKLNINGKVEHYIYSIMRLARLYFGPRVQPWNDGLNQFDYYSWSEVDDSFRLYNQPRSSSSIDVPPFEVRDIPGKGRGLIAKIDIPAGARILCEKPLLLANPMASEDLEATVATKLKALSKSQQRQFLSLHNNFPGNYPLSGIIRTNALPCSAGESVGGIYPTISLINHSCLANSLNNWNSEAGHETIRAIRPIKAGEEITINYDEGGPSNVRRPMLKKSFGFDCTCSLCTLPPSQLQASDDRRVRIQQLDASIRDSLAIATDPNASLKSCLSLLYTLEEEYGVCAVQHNARLYYYAFQICIAYGDVGRATTFAERSYRAKVICGGEDNEETLRLKTLVLQPTTHSSYGALSMRWKTDREESFSGYNTVEFEKWLFRQGC